MHGFERHNRSATVPTKTCMGSLPLRIFANERGFPAALRAMPEPASTLWYAGRLPDEGERMVAIVGARAATHTACGLTRDLAAALAGRGYGVVSGGALGTGGPAHRGALAAGGRPDAVVGGRG